MRTRLAWLPEHRPLRSRAYLPLFGAARTGTCMKRSHTRLRLETIELKRI